MRPANICIWTAFASVGLQGCHGDTQTERKKEQIWEAKWPPYSCHPGHLDEWALQPVQRIRELAVSLINGRIMEEEEIWKSHGYFSPSHAGTVGMKNVNAKMKISEMLLAGLRCCRSRWLICNFKQLSAPGICSSAVWMSPGN